MASTSVPPIIKEIEALFAWNPPRLSIVPKHDVPSTSSRKPAFYDKHLTQKLILKHVKHLPSLAQQLVENVDKALCEASEIFPPVEGFATTQYRAVDGPNLGTAVRDEKAVVSFYDRTTSKYCIPLASRLALHSKALSPNWRALLFWTPSPGSPSQAIEDGRLCFVIADDDAKHRAEQELLIESMESETQCVFKDLRDSDATLATWEIKSLSVGSREVMAVILTLDEFSWTFCPDDTCKTALSHEMQQENAKLAEETLGPDAEHSPWKWEEDDLSNSSIDSLNHDNTIDMLLPTSLSEVPSGTLQERVHQYVTRSATASGSTSMPPPDASLGASLVKKPEVPEKGKEIDEDKGAAGGRKRKRDDGHDHDNKAYEDRHDRTAHNIVQQAWAQAVRADGTILVVHSGNYELVCLRHRASQTLYISDLIEPPTCKNPGYGKLQVGIYVAAVQDAIARRKQQLDTMSPTQSPDDDDDSVSSDSDHSSRGGRKGSRGYRRGRGGGGGHGHGAGGSGRGLGGRGRFRSGTGEGNRGVDALETIEEIIRVAATRDLVLLYLRYDIYNSPIPASFLRSVPLAMGGMKFPSPPISPRAISSYRPNECLPIILTSQIGRGATGIVHRGTLELQIAGGSVLLDVVVKLAFDTEQQDDLRAEYEVYRLLRSKGVITGITTALGIFDDCEGGTCALVMFYSGVSLYGEREHVLPVSDCKAALSTLASIHRAGILHGDIREENILVSESGITIIDFAQSSQCDDQKTKDKEYRVLRHILDLEEDSDRE